MSLGPTSQMEKGPQAQVTHKLSGPTGQMNMEKGPTGLGPTGQMEKGPTSKVENRREKSRSVSFRFLLSSVCFCICGIPFP